MKKLILLSFVLTMIFSACSPSDKKILNNAECNAPCWRGIIPGQTIRIDILTKLRSMEDIDASTINETYGGFQYWQRGFTWSFAGVKEKSGAIYFHEDKPIFIYLFYGKNTELSEVISKIGEPDKVYATIGFVETSMETINLVYSNGICVQLFSNEYSQKEIKQPLFCKSEVRNTHSSLTFE